jgi:hypothetical protein
MKQTKPVRTKWLTIRLSEEEEKNLLKLFRRTTAANLSEYARNVLLQEPVTVFYRNQSADDFLAEMLLLKKELNAIGNNLNQAVHKLHILDHIPQIHDWTVMQETTNKIIFKKVEEISYHLQQVYELWSQK